MNRPFLKLGDLVMLKNSVDGKMYRVTFITAEVVDIKKLHLGRRFRPKNHTDEGFVKISIQHKEEPEKVFNRRDLWRVPNQPREKYKKKPLTLGRETGVQPYNKKHHAIYNVTSTQVSSSRYPF